MTDIHQTIQYANYLSKIGWIVERSAEVNYFIKKLPLVGSIIKIQRPEEIRIGKIRELAKRYRALQIIIEPKDMLNGQWLMANGFKSSKSPYLPTKTLQIDLTQTKEKILRAFAKDTKTALRKTKNIKTRKVDLETFRNAWKKSVGLKRYIPPLSHLVALKKSFKKNCLFLSTGLPRQSGAAAGAIFLLADNMAYYWQAFTGKEGRKKLCQYKIVWEGILWAKKNGAKIFDFEGIYDERFPNKSWFGFSHFKKSFGGYELLYPGCFVKNMLPFGI